MDFNLDALEEDSYSTKVLTNEELLNKLATYEEYLTKVSTEGLVSGTGKVLVAITDVLARLVMNLKTTLTRFHKAAKRSELRYYCNSYPLKVRSIKNTEYLSMMGIDTPVPSGMIGTYPDVIHAMDVLYTNMDIHNNCSLIRATIIRLNKILSSKGSGHTEYLLNNARQLKEVSKTLEKPYENFTKNFKNERTNTVPFKDLFKSSNEFSKCIEDLLKMEKWIHSVSKVHSTMETIDSNTQKLISIITDDKSDQFNRTFVLSLAAYIRASASLIDMFAKTVETQMAVEHNMICTMDIIYSTKA